MAGEVEKHPCVHCLGAHPAGWTHCPTTGGELRAGASLVGHLIADRFEVLHVLGRGGMGLVYHALDRQTKSEVAVKCLHAHHVTQRRARNRFVREANAAASIRHKNVVTVYEAGQDESGTPYLTMELLNGESLDALISRQGALSVEQAAGIASKVLAGLTAVHHARIIHRDLKPGNVFISDQREIKLLDFGVSKLESDADMQTLTRTGAPLGTPVYMSPEQARGSTNVDHRSDLYACGVVLYEMLTGQRPHREGNFHAMLRAVMVGDRIPITRWLPSLPPALVEVIDTALSTQPADRFPSAHAMAMALLPFTPSSLKLPPRPAKTPVPRPEAEPTTSLSAASVHDDVPEHAVKGRFIIALARESAELRRAVAPLSVSLPILWVEQGQLEAALERCTVAELRRSGRAVADTLLMRIPWRKAGVAKLMARLPPIHRSFFMGSDLKINDMMLHWIGTEPGPALSTTLAGFYEGALLRGGVRADLFRVSGGFRVNVLE